MKKVILTLVLAVASAAVADIPMPRRNGTVVRHVSGYAAVRLWNSMAHVPAVQLPSNRMVAVSQKTEHTYRTTTQCTRTSNLRTRRTTVRCTIATQTRGPRLG